jgi:hypothetical protein
LLDHVREDGDAYVLVLPSGEHVGLERGDGTHRRMSAG